MQNDLIIKNGTVVTPDATSVTDVAIRNGKISAIGPNLHATRELDASGKLVIPGAVDIHVHMQMPFPDVTTADTFFSGTRAAALGGTTSIIDFVHSEPKHATLMQALSERRAEADPQVAIDYGLHLAIGPNDLDKLGEIPAIAAAGVGSYKLYMVYGFRLMDDQLYRSLRAIKGVGGMTVIHTENWEMILALQAEALTRGDTDPRWHPLTRPALLEAEACGRAIDIATYLDMPLHIFHISTDLVVDRIRAARARGLAITGETCPQYLHLTQDAYARAGVLGALPVCAPPIREQHEQDALWRSLAAGDIDLVASDHCPFMIADKQKGVDKDFTQIPGGVPGVEPRLSAVYQGVRRGLLSLERWVDACCTQPARVVGLQNKGVLAIGYDADVVIFDPEKAVTISQENDHSLSDYSLYEGMMFNGWAETVLSRGELVVDSAEFVGSAGQGQFQLTRQKSS